MGKWYGKIGFSESVEVTPGIWEASVTERMYYGELLKNTNRRTQNSDDVNDNITFSNDISIVADPFALDNFQNILYLEFRGTKWKVTNAEVNFPRIRLSLGGVYNGITPIETTE